MTNTDIVGTKASYSGIYNGETRSFTSKFEVGQQVRIRFHRNKERVGQLVTVRVITPVHYPASCSWQYVVDPYDGITIEEYELEAVA